MSDDDAAAKEAWRQSQREAHQRQQRKRQATQQQPAAAPVIRRVWSLDAIMEDEDGLRKFVKFCEETFADEDSPPASPRLDASTAYRC